MQKAQDDISYFFVDESGDPTFYDRHGNLIVGTEGVSKILLLGFIHTKNPKPIRKALQKLNREIAQDKYLQGIPSLRKTLLAFHAKDDSPEIKEKVFKTIVKLDFTAEVFVGRKIQNIFNVRHHRNENEFYDDLISKLFENKLHLAGHNEIFFAVRGNKTRQIPLEQAIEKATSNFESKWKKKVDSIIKINPQSPSGEPCLQVIDYINWAIQRVFIKKDMRFYKFIEEKIKFLVDIYDTDKYPKNFYNSKNKFDVIKISPL
ncbi:MAG: DUF3800 domain-containing protein [Candidatus Levybacteria bacterium]|nr:DUF3800 domain-containing protein [Candidatus Levybacteria bacterium]